MYLPCGGGLVPRLYCQSQGDPNGPSEDQGNHLMAKTKFAWNKEAQESFETLKTAFTTAPILRHFDPTKPVILEADASGLALGGIVSQRDKDGCLHPIAYYSRKFTPAELNYEVYDREMLAIVQTMEHY
jgi:hypothetical protein